MTKEKDPILLKRNGNGKHAFRFIKFGLFRNEINQWTVRPRYEMKNVERIERNETKRKHGSFVPLHFISLSNSVHTVFSFIKLNHAYIVFNLIKRNTV